MKAYKERRFKKAQGMGDCMSLLPTPNHKKKNHGYGIGSVKIGVGYHLLLPAKKGSQPFVTGVLVVGIPVLIVT